MKLLSMVVKIVNVIAVVGLAFPACYAQARSEGPAGVSTLAPAISPTGQVNLTTQQASGAYHLFITTSNNSTFAFRVAVQYRTHDQVGTPNISSMVVVVGREIAVRKEIPAHVEVTGAEELVGVTVQELGILRYTVFNSPQN